MRVRAFVAVSFAALVASFGFAASAARADDDGVPVRITLKDGRVVEGVLRGVPSRLGFDENGEAPPGELARDDVWRIELIPTDGSLPPDLAPLVAALDDGNAPAERMRAIEQLAMKGRSASLAIPRLAELARGTDPRVAQAAARALGFLGEGAIPSLLELIRGDDPAARRNAMGGLQEIGEAGAASIITLLDEERPEVREAGLQGIGWLPPGKLQGVVPRLVELAVAGDRGSQLAVRQLARIAPAAAAERIVAILADPARRRGASMTLGRLGPKAVEVALPPLQAMLESDDAETRIDAINALGLFGEAAAPAVPKLVELLAGSDGTRAASALGRIEGAGVAALLVAAGDERAEVRRVAISHLPVRRPEDRVEGVVELLVAALSDEDAGVRRAAATATTFTKDLPAPLMRALVGALGDADVSVAQVVVRAVGSLGAAAVKPLVAVLDAEGGSAPIRAASAILQLDLADEQAELRARAVDLIGAAVVASDAPRRAEGWRAFRWLRGRNAELADALVAALRHDDHDVRAGALRVVAEPGVLPDGASIRAVLVELARGESVASASQAVRALGALPTPAPEREALARLLAELIAPNGRDPAVVLEAVRAIGRLGEAAAPAIPALEALVADEATSPLLREQAERVLTAIRR